MLLAACLLGSLSGCKSDSQYAARERLAEWNVKVHVRTSRRGPDRFSVELTQDEGALDALCLVRDSLRPIDRLSCRDRKLSPLCLAVISQLEELQELDLFGVALPERPSKIARLKHLKRLNLAGADNGDEALKSIQELRLLESLAVGSRTTDAGLVWLVGMPRLNELFLGDSLVIGHGLGSLAGLSELKTLRLDRTAFGDTQASVLAKFAQLERLGLAGTNVSDQGLSKLRVLKQLDYLSLEDTSVTDAGLGILAELPALYVLDLPGSKVTAKGVEKLRQDRPGLIVTSTHRPPEPAEEKPRKAAPTKLGA